MSEAYFKGMWTAVSIFIPVSFGLVGASYASEEIMKLEWINLVPLALASILLYVFGMAFVSRYAGYNKSIIERLWLIEENSNMKLHRHIRDNDKKKWNLRYVKWIMFFCLIITWIVRLYISPLI